MIEQNGIVEPMQAAQHYVPPGPREKRSQAVYRLQVGLFGLCAMLLIVGLANIIRDRVAEAETLADQADQEGALDISPAFGCSIDGEALHVGQRLGDCVCDVDGLLKSARWTDCP